MPTNGLENPARPRPDLPAVSPAEVEPPCGRERSKSPRAKSRAQPRDRERSQKTSPERAEKPTFLIATRTYSREELTRRKHRMIRFSNRHKIHFVNGVALLRSTEDSRRK